jgi:glycosyltransferase involved in cell wall biosynthesis
MNILHVSPTYYPATYWGGPIFSVHCLNTALARHEDLDVRVLTTDAAGPAQSDRLPVGTDRPTTDGYNHAVQFCKRIAGVSVSTQMLWRLPGAVRRAELVHLTAAYSFSTIPTLALARIFGKPVVWSPRGALQASHEWSHARRKALKVAWERCIRLIVKRGRCTLHVTSEEERLASTARIPEASARIVQNGVDVPGDLPRRTWKPDGRLRLLFLGRLDPKKGIENLLSALTMLDTPFELSICGTGDTSYEHALSKAVNADGLADRVVFRGHVDGSAKRDAFLSADLCIVPSHSENFCMVVAEALAHGVPVIASKGTPWAGIEQRACGLWVDNSPASLARAIDALAPQDLEQMGARGRAWMQSDFGWNGIAQQMHALYKEAIERG